MLVQAQEGRKKKGQSWFEDHSKPRYSPNCLPTCTKSWLARGPS
jgi:hypothetical protein